MSFADLDFHYRLSMSEHQVQPDWLLCVTKAIVPISAKHPERCADVPANSPWKQLFLDMSQNLRRYWTSWRTPCSPGGSRISFCRYASSLLAMFLFAVLTVFISPKGQMSRRHVLWTHEVLWTRTGHACRVIHDFLPFMLSVWLRRKMPWWPLLP